MSMQKPLEGLLRPPLEWYSAATGFAAASVLYAKTAYFLLPTSFAYTGIAGLSLFSLLRFKQGYKIWRYQRNLKRMPTYTITSKQLPVSKKRLFLGKGFLWTPLHTQRLRDLDLDYNLKYCYPSSFYRWTRHAEFAWENKILLKHIVPLLKKDSVLNPFRPYPDIGGEPCLHGVADKEHSVSLSLIERAGHMIVIGTTGVGKTRFAEILISQDIHRGDVVIVLDPKGDVDLLKRILIEATLAKREKDLLIFHLAFPESSCRYNPIGHFTKITQVATRVTNALPSTGEAASFKEFAWKYVNLVARTLVALNVTPTYKLINFYITKLDQLLIRYCEEVINKNDPNYDRWLVEFMQQNTKMDKNGNKIKLSRKQAILAYVEDAIESLHQGQLKTLENNLLADLAAAYRLDRTYYDKITASVGPLLEKLTTGSIADLLSPQEDKLEDQRPIMDWLDVIKNKKIVYVGMDALTDSVISSAVGNAMLSDLVSVAGYLYNFGLEPEELGEIKNQKKGAVPLPRVCLHSDEFNEIIGDEFIPILNKARGAGFNVTAYTQTWSDVEARLFSQAKAGQVAGNLNTVIMFRTKEAKTVDMLLNQLPKIPILRTIPASSSSDSPHGEQGIFYQSTNEDRFAHSEVRLIEQTDILNLPKGQAFCLLEGGKLYKIRVPLPVQDNTKIAMSVELFLEKMRSLQKSEQKSMQNKSIGNAQLLSEKNDIFAAFLTYLENCPVFENRLLGWLRLSEGLFVPLQTMCHFMIANKSLKNIQHLIDSLKAWLLEKEGEYQLQIRPRTLEDQRVLEGILISEIYLPMYWKKQTIHQEYHLAINYD